MLCFPRTVHRKGIMSILQAEIVRYLSSQSGILPHMMEKNPSLGNRIGAWLIGKKSILIIGGEPGSGKSLLMGELVLRHRELVELHPRLQTSLILVSYDRIHHLLCKCLAQIRKTEQQNFLPEGETHPKARKLITEIMCDALWFALHYLPKNIPIILEAPLISHRGEEIVDEFLTKQIFIMHSPGMRMRVYDQEEQQIRGRSAQRLAMEQIHESLLKEREITSISKLDQDKALEKSWKQWIKSRDGIVLSWDPADDETGFAHTVNMLKANNIPPDPIAPEVLGKYITSLANLVLETIPDPQAFATKVFSYKRL
jgi:hypothetical protein